MGDFIGTVKVKHKKDKDKAAKKTKKAAHRPKRISIVGRIRNNPKRTQALVKELKRLASRYKFKVREA